MTLILLGAALVWALAYFRANLSTWTGAFVFLIGIWTFVHGGFIDGLAWLVWMVFLAAAAIANIPLLRRTLLVKPFLCRFRRMTPSLSRTEREALEAGTVWWDGELFTGNPNWNKLLAIPQPKLTDEELSFLDGPVEELCRMLDDWKIVADTKDLPQEVWQFIRKQRFFGMIIPKEYGGMGFSTYAHSQVITKIAGRSVTAAITVMVPNSLGPAELLLHYGTVEQKKYYLPRLAGGEEIPCFALTGPEAGSDAASIPDMGRICLGNFRGKEIIGIGIHIEQRLHLHRKFPG